MLAVITSVLLGLLVVHSWEGETSGAAVAQTSSVVATLFSSLVDVVRLIVGAVVGLPVYVVTNPLFVSRLAGLVGLALAVHHWHVEFLGVMDGFWRKVLNPTVHFMYSFTFLLRVPYEPLSAVYNWWVSVGRTALYGTLGLATKCSIELFKTTAAALVEVVVIFFRSVLFFFGGAGGSIFENDFDITEMVEAIQTVIVVQREIFDCACEELSSIFNVAVAVVRPKPLAKAMNHGLNVFVSLLQELFKMLPRWGQYPTLRKPFYHASGFVHNIGLWIDEAMLSSVSVALKDVFKLEPILEKDRPAKFLGSAYMSLVQSALYTLYLGARATVHLLIPLRLSDPKYVFQMLSAREIFDVHMRESVNAATLSVHWVLDYAYNRLNNKPAPAPVLECKTLDPAFYGDRIFNSFFCAARNIGRSLTTVLAVASTLPVEFMVMTVIAQERNGFQLLQRYDGPFRNLPLGASACEVREKSDWDMSTDVSFCDCTLDEDIARPYPKFDENVWSSLSGDKSVSCAQPQLQDAILEFKEAVRHSSHVIVPFLAPFYKTYFITVSDAVSVGLRLALSSSDIISGDFFQLPLGRAGYGAREDLALAKWVEEGNQITSAGCKKGQIKETALPSSPCMSLDNVVRLHDARVQRFDGGSLCRTTNSRDNCMCNPALEISEDSRCQCMFVFPDDESTAAYSYTTARFYSEDFQMFGWCGSQILEPIFRGLEQESGDALSSLVDALNGESEVGWCGQEEYLVMQTNMNQLTRREWQADAFLRDRGLFTEKELRQNIDARVQQRLDARVRAQLSTSATQEVDIELEETRAAVVEIQGERALADATSSCVIEQHSGLTVDSHDFDEKVATTQITSSCLVAKTTSRSKLLAKWKENTCSVYGSHDFMCSLNGYAERAAKIYIGTARQLWNSAVALLNGDVKLVNWDLSNRLCDMQQSIGYQMSVLSGLFPVERDTRRAVNKLLFLAAEWNVEQLGLVNSGLVLLDATVKGELFTSSTKEGPILEFIEKIAGTYLVYGANVLKATSDLIESFNGSGEFLDSLADFMLQFKDILTDQLVKIVVFYIELVGEFVAVVSGKTEQIPALINSIIKFLSHIKTLIPRLAMQLMGIILESLGPVGKFISKLVGEICNVLETIINSIIAAINGISMGFANLDDLDMGCLKGFGADGADAVNATLAQSRRGMNQLPQIIYELGWNGPSFCDGIVRGYKDFQWHALRPLEQHNLVLCLKQRYIGVKIAEQTGIDDLQAVVYDWGKRFHAVKSLARALYAYFDGMTPSQSKHFLTRVEFRQYLPAVQKLSTLTASVVNADNAKRLFSDVVTTMSETMRSEGGSSKRAGDIIHNAKHIAESFADHWLQRNMTLGFGTLLTTPLNFNETHVPLDIQFGRDPQIKEVWMSSRRKLSVVAAGAATFVDQTAKYAFGAAGVQSDVNPCASEFSIVCTNCAIIDNVLQTAVEEGVRVILFLRYTWTEITLPLFAEHVKTRGLQLSSGIAQGVEGVFSDVTMPRPPNMAQAFDRVRASGAASAAYLAKSIVSGSGKAADMLEFGLKSSSKKAFDKTADSADALGSLEQKNIKYDMGSDGVQHPYRVMSIAEKQAIDWEFLWQNWPNLPANVTHSRDYVPVEGSVPTISLIKAFGLYVSLTTDEYVPLFGQPLFYSLSQPLLEKCDMSQTVYSESTTQQERMDRIDHGLWIVLWGGVFVLVFQYYVGIPLFALILSPIIVSVLFYGFMFIVYKFTYNCTPNIPVLAFADATAFIGDRMHPYPLCQRWPALAEECDPQTSMSFYGETKWQTCFDDEAVDELGYFFSTAHYTRAWLPDLYSYLRTTQPFRYWLSGFKTLDLLDEETTLRENCARLLFMDMVGVFSVAGVALFIVFSIVIPPVVSVVRAAVALSIQIIGLANILVISVSKVEE